MIYHEGKGTERWFTVPKDTNPCRTIWIVATFCCFVEIIFFVVGRRCRGGAADKSGSYRLWLCSVKCIINVVLHFIFAGFGLWFGLWIKWRNPVFLCRWSWIQDSTGNGGWPEYRGSLYCRDTRLWTYTKLWVPNSCYWSRWELQWFIETCYYKTWARSWLWLRLHEASFWGLSFGPVIPLLVIQDSRIFY